MATTAIEKIKEHIINKEHFVLSGGAGSGKTYTLMEVLKVIFEENKKAKVACITYTNVAVNEIKERSPYENLRVSTIHNFLWDNIKPFQKNLKISLVELIGKGEIKYKGEENINAEFFKDKKIDYHEYRKLEDGIISHYEVIKLANYMFGKYPRLCEILKDKYDYILIDEYQDTDKKVIEIFLKFLQEEPKKKNVLGFFGDSMQSIYSNNGAVGNIQKYIDIGLVKEVKKGDNYRCSKAVIDFLNKIRPKFDAIKQEPSKKDNDGNIINKEGSVKFLYSNSDISLNQIKKHEVFNNWNFQTSKETKELYLTHRLIAGENEFGQIYDLYAKKNDRLLNRANQDKLIKHVFKIQDLIYFYENKKYNEFIKKADFKIKSLVDKKYLKAKIEKLKNIEGKNIETIVNLAYELGLVKKDDNFETFIKENKEDYDAVKNLDYKQIANVYEYVEEFTPFSTQHGIKGTEFDNVFVVLDNANWNLYNFKYLFEETAGKNIERTLKIFYVCCSRAKDNLVLFFPNPSQLAINKAVEWFGNENVIEI